jgi:hypothetical protein
MIGKIASGLIGRRLAGRSERGRGALTGFVAPILVKRVTPALALTIGAGWAARKFWNRRRSRAAA